MTAPSLPDQMPRLPSPTRVSVLIAAYEIEHALGSAVGSALAQGGEDLEILVIDDASTDGTAAAAAALAARDPRVRLIRHDCNLGPGAARASGLVEARGDWVAILDADDSFAPGRLDALLSIAETRGLDAVADNLTFIDPGSGAAVGRAFPLEQDQTWHLTPERFLDNAVPGGRIQLGWMKPMIRRAFLERHAITWRAIRHGEDLLFAMELLLAGARFEVIGREGYRYTQRRGSMTGARSTLSRTLRSAAEQKRALSLLLEDDRLRPALSNRLRRRLAGRAHEIDTMDALLDLAEAVRARDLRAAAAGIAAALRAPASLARILRARYGPGAYRLDVS